MFGRKKAPHSSHTSHNLAIQNHSVGFRLRAPQSKHTPNPKTRNPGTLNRKPKMMFNSQALGPPLQAGPEKEKKYSAVKQTVNHSIQHSQLAPSFSADEVRQAGDDLRSVLNERYEARAFVDYSQAPNSKHPKGPHRKCGSQYINSLIWDACY